VRLQTFLRLLRKLKKQKGGNNENTYAIEENDNITFVRDGGEGLTVEVGLGDNGALVSLVSERGVDTIIIKAPKVTNNDRR